MTDEDDATEWRYSLGYEEQPAIHAGKRLGVRWAPWMGDYFTSWSPRNDNENAEGPWDQWVDLALKILADPMTKIVRPEVWVESPQVKNYYAEANTYVDDQQLRERFATPSVSEPAGETT